MQELKQSQKAFEQKETNKLYENLNKNSFKALVKNIPVQIMYERVLDLIEKQGKTIAQVAFELDCKRPITRYIENLQSHSTLEILFFIYNLLVQFLTMANKLLELLFLRKTPH